MKDLLICIAYHHSPERIPLLDKVLSNIVANYKCSFDIIVHTNTDFEYQYVSQVTNGSIGFWVEKLEHPYHLTFCHRSFMVSKINQYKNFMYLEDDMIIPYRNYLNYLENFRLLYSKNYVPSFIRIERKDKELFVTDVTEPQFPTYVVIGGKLFASLDQPYHAFWIMPQNELKQNIAQLNDTMYVSREHAASFPMWTLNKRPLVEIENMKVSELSYSYHISNSYVNQEGSPFGKLKPENIFK